jgi:hypothetical protein
MLAICGGLMRTGSVAMFQVMREIVESQGAGYAPTFPRNRELEYWEEHIGEWVESDEVVVAKLHKWEDFLDPHVQELKVVMTIRDMRDVAVSLMNFRGGTFENAVHSEAFKANTREEIRWNINGGEDRVMTVRYEDFVLVRAVTTKAVAEFLGITVTLSEAMTIEQKWNINANLRRARAGYPESHPEFMSERHIKSGKVGQWKKALTEEQIQYIQDRLGPMWFHDRGYDWYE